MSSTTTTYPDEVTSTFDPLEILLMLLAVAGGAFAAAIVLPTWLPGLTESLLGAQPKAYWYLARASGFMAYVVLWLSVALGLIISNKMARLWNGGPTAVDLHQFTAWLAVGLTIFHALILTGDQYIQSTVIQVLLPFGYENYKPAWVGIGQLAFYLSVLIAASFYFRKQLSYRAWRTFHYGSFIVFVFITLHASFAGTDSAALLRAYLIFGLAIYFLTMYRIFQSIRVKAVKPASPKPVRAQMESASVRGRDPS
jgi:predicted ferric reductase